MAAKKKSSPPPAADKSDSAPSVKGSLTTERYLARREKAMSKKEQFRALMQDIEDLSAPDRACWVKGSDGQKRNKTFDSTAINARSSFANRIQSDMMPPFQQWVVLKPGEFVPENQKEEMEKELDDASKKFYAVIQSSNFDTAINEFLHDLAAGTAVMIPEDGDIDSPMGFYAVPPSTVGIEEGAFGKVSGVYRDHCLRVSAIQETWPDAQITTDMNNDIMRNDKSSADKEYEISEGCVYDPTTKKWLYKVVDRKSKTYIVERVYDRNRFLVTRWSKLSGEVWGRGPLVNALPDIKTINKLVEMILRQAALRIAGVWTVTNDGIINPNNIVITPGATIPVGRNGGPNGPSMANIAPTGDIQVAELEREKLSTSIKQMLFDQKLPPDTGAVRSATEIMARVKELVKDIGAPFGRLMGELVHPLVQCVLDMLYKRGQIKHRIVIDGLLVKAQVISPLAQVQSLTDVENVVRWMQILAGFGNEILYVSAKMEDIGDYLGERLGVPVDLRRNKQERDTMQKTLAQVAAASAQGGPSPSVPAGVGAGQGKSIPVA